MESGKTKGSFKPRRKGQLLSATTAAMKEIVDESDDDHDDHMETDGDNGPLWQLFDQLYNQANSAGKSMGFDTFHDVTFILLTVCFI